MSVKVVFQDVDGDEVVVGAFGGVCVECSDMISLDGTPGPTRIVDVATRETIAYNYGAYWAYKEAWYPRAFIQAVVEGEEV